MAKLPLAILALLTLVAAFPAPEKEFYVDLAIKSSSDLQKLKDRGFDFVGLDLDRNVITVLLPKSRLSSVRSEEVAAVRPVPILDREYKRYEDIERILFKTASDFPFLANIEIIGQSVEGRSIYAVHLSNHQLVGEKRAVIFDAMHHAREVMTPEVALDIVDHLTKNYATDPKVKDWMDRYNIWIVPMVNPDGNNKVWTLQTMWRKNALGGYGVDNNRNYPHAWNTCQGSSGSKNDETYRGSKPASEPETNALMDLAKRVRPMFNISYHSTSEIVIYPFGCSPKHIPSPDREVYEKVGRELASRLVRDSGQGTYKAGTAYELLYNVDGGSIDWMYASDKIMSFVVEINSSNQGFQPSFKTWRDKTVEKQRAGWKYILDRMSEPGIKP